METKDKCFILKENSEEIRQKIRSAGISVCICAEFVDACWLDYSTRVKNGVHGVGYWSEYVGVKSQKAALDLFLCELKNPVWCSSVDEFIDEILKWEHNK